MSESVEHYDCTICSSPLQVAAGKIAVCDRCGHRDNRLMYKSSQLCLVFTVTALIFYIPANFLPFMTIELYGNRSSSTIWSGITSLMDQQSYFIALVVFLASLLIPILKLLILFYLSVFGPNGEHAKFKMALYHFVEAIGRWSMLDIFLLAVLVAMMKLGKFTTVHAEKGATMFLLVVIFTMMASAYFDPRILWKKSHEENHKA